MKYYLAIDLKSFYASVECMERGMDPLNTNLVVADSSRTEKTICLAVSPALKEFGIPGRPRLYQVVSRVSAVNNQRLELCKKSGYKEFTEASIFADELKSKPDLELDYVIAPPRMAHYIEYSNKIYEIYLRYVSAQDMHVYSIDEVFIDITSYLKTYRMTPHQLAMKMIRTVQKETGITATAGIGTNLYLAKIAMDIVAKRMPADSDGVRIAELDEIEYRRLMWGHKPITDFWRVGKGYAKRLKKYGIYTMGDIARCSIGGERDFFNEDLLYKLFGKNAELLIDHAWGYEPCTISDIKNYSPSTHSIGSGQVLQEPYSTQDARLVTWEMVDLLVYELVEKGFFTNKITLEIGYDIENIRNSGIEYTGETVVDPYGRMIPKPSHGTENIDRYTSSSVKIIDATMKLYDRIVEKGLLIRRLNVTAERLIREDELPKEGPVQLTVFDILNSDTNSFYSKEESKNKVVASNKKEGMEDYDKEKDLQKAVLTIKKKYGKNALIKGANLKEEATAIKRNGQIGGHKA